MINFYRFENNYYNIKYNIESYIKNNFILLSQFF
jgi:hypothetical protein